MSQTVETIAKLAHPKMTYRFLGNSGKIKRLIPPLIKA
jgi:hypothetical protein